INASGIVLRLAFVMSYDIFTDFSVWFTVWAALLGGAPLILERDGHVAIDFLPRRLGPKGPALATVLGLIVTLICAIGLAYGGYLMVESLYTRGLVYPRIVDVPQWLVR